jgi:very-short-patch-repair endonuclease
MARSIAVDMSRFGGLALRSDLFALGHSRSEIRRAVATGQLTVPRRYWVATDSAPPAGRRAVFLGGRLGGASALVSYGVWVDDTEPLVVSCARTSSRLPALLPGERRSYLRVQFLEGGDYRWRVSLPDAVLQHAQTCSRDELIAVLDSALHRGLLRWNQLDPLLAAIPRRMCPSSGDLDAKSMSGTESHIRIALRRTGYHVETQVDVPTVGFVDLLIDGWFIVECDSREHHDGVHSQTRDRRRDGNAARTGYASARFSYSQIMFEMPWCLDVVASGLARGRPIHPK